MLRQHRPRAISATRPVLGDRQLVVDRAVPFLFTENETNEAATPTGAVRSGCRSTSCCIGASHQTGWTGLVAWLLKSREILDPDEVLAKGNDAVALKIVRSY